MNFMLAAMTAAADAKKKYAPANDLIASLKAPVYMGHRGGLLVYPEESMEGFRASMQDGFLPEMDIQELADGALVLCHDSTADRTMTGVTGALSNLTSAQWRAARLKPAIKGGKEALPVFVDQVLDELGGKCVLVPEIKSANTTAATKLIAMVKARGLTRSVIVQSGDFAICQQITAAGLEALYLFSGTPAYTADQIKAAGINYVGPESAVTSDTVASMKAAGLKVWVWTIDTLAAKATQDAKSVDGYFSNDPWTLSGRVKASTGDPFAEGIGWPGLKSNYITTSVSTTPLPHTAELAGRALAFPIATGGSGSVAAVRLVYCDWAGKKINLPVEIAMRIEFGSTTAAGATTAQLAAGFYLFNNTDSSDMVVDGAHPGQNGFTVVARRNGQLQAWKYVNGAAAVSIGASTPTAEFAPLNTPGVVDLVVRFDGTNVTMAAVDRGIVFVAPDTFVPTDLRLALRVANGTDAMITNVRVRKIG